jgi:hypothetical protein
MTTRVDYMAALKSSWERAPIGPEKLAALIKYEGAKHSNIARIEKAATVYRIKAKTSCK